MAFAVTAALDALDRALRRLAPDAEREERAGTIRYAVPGARPFAVLRPFARRVDVGFTRVGRARAKRILDARVAKLPGVRFRVIVEAPGDVDSELTSWLAESLELSREFPL